VWRTDGPEADCAAGESQSTAGPGLRVRAGGREQSCSGGQQPR
jgi:hypothetical protein